MSLLSTDENPAERIADAGDILLAIPLRGGRICHTF
jgi:hypothetical protein